MNADELTAVTAQAAEEARTAPDAQALEAIRVKYLGRNGLLPRIMEGIKDIPPAEKKAYGQRANAFKLAVTEAVQARQAALQDQAAAPAATFDGSQPGCWPRLGSRHPITQIIERAAEIFGALGFRVADGPDIEDIFHNFDALNHPDTHPARDPKDTFYLDDGRLLRTHTSPVQIRHMERHEPPVRIIAPGRAYRRDTPDATHSASFHQIEGLYVDRDVSMADLKSDLSTFARQMMGPDVRVRMRPHFFPFTEPSVEVDFSCHVCGGGDLSRRSPEGGAGCRVCTHSGWIEIAGAGMVNPRVLKAVGYDPEAVTGYAFGMGVERIAMILHGIPDIRMLYDNDVRFLAQFG